MQKLQKMQQDAENYLANLSRNTENELGQQQLQLNDSIENYVKVYNASKGYDAILSKLPAFISIRRSISHVISSMGSTPVTIRLTLPSKKRSI